MKDFFRRRVLHNFTLKVVSLLLAIALWLVVSNNPTAEVAVDVPIEFHNFPEHLEIGYGVIPKTQVRMRGPERAVRRLQPSDVRAEVDLTGAKPGERTFVLTADQVSKPSDLQVVQIIPNQFHLTFREAREQ